jgi:hypothetical protein
MPIPELVKLYLRHGGLEPLISKLIIQSRRMECAPKAHRGPAHNEKATYC